MIRTAAIRAGSALIRGTITAWRYLCTLLTLARLGLLWKAFCAATGLAIQRTHTDPYGTRLHTTVHAVPRLDRYRVNAHGWTMRVRLRPGQHLGQYTEAAIPLRHTARVQAVKAIELPEQPGFLELRILRRDPLVRVTERPWEIEAGRLAVGATETGDPMVLDFTEHPHYQLIGATGSGKSMLLSCVQAAIAPTDGVLVFWDLKFGIEAEAWRARYTQVATTQREVLSSCGRVLWLAEQRAAILRRLGVRNVAEADVAGVHLRRVYVLVDEVAELAHDHQTDKSPTSCSASCCASCSWSARWASTSSSAGSGSAPTWARTSPASARRCPGGSASRSTTRRPRRWCSAVSHLNDRCSYLTTVEIRALAAAHADKRIGWDELAADDQLAAAIHNRQKTSR